MALLSASQEEATSMQPPPLGASNIIPVTEMSYAVKVGPFKTSFIPGTRVQGLCGPAGSGSLSPLGFHID